MEYTTEDGTAKRGSYKYVLDDKGRRIATLWVDDSADKSAVVDAIHKSIA